MIQTSENFFDHLCKLPDASKCVHMHPDRPKQFQMSQNKCENFNNFAKTLYNLANAMISLAHKHRILIIYAHRNAFAHSDTSTISDIPLL